MTSLILHCLTAVCPASLPDATPHSCPICLGHVCLVTAPVGVALSVLAVWMVDIHRQCTQTGCSKAGTPAVSFECMGSCGWGSLLQRPYCRPAASSMEGGGGALPPSVRQDVGSCAKALPTGGDWLHQGDCCVEQSGVCLLSEPQVVTSNTN